MNNHQRCEPRRGPFESLTPDLVISAVEEALGEPMSPLAASLPSYINRVYELQTAGGERLIGKFLRPGRWSLAAVRDEHAFVADCAAEDIPVVSPLPLRKHVDSISTIGNVDGVLFAIYPKRSGRELNLDDEESWLRLGSVAARMHLAGDMRKAEARVKLHPELSTRNDLNELLAGGVIPMESRREFEEIANEIIEKATPLFNGCETTRLHGDCHRANILERPGEGILVIDFDDMMVGPPIQDLWLLLPGHLTQCRSEMDLLIEGYERFRDFDESSTRMVEALRAMRMIYFLAWSHRQSMDYNFRNEHPDWGTDAFWRSEIQDLKNQLAVLKSTEEVMTGARGSTAYERILTDH